MNAKNLCAILMCMFIFVFWPVSAKGQQLSNSQVQSSQRANTAKIKLQVSNGGKNLGDKEIIAIFGRPAQLRQTATLSGGENIRIGLIASPVTTPKGTQAIKISITVARRESEWRIEHNSDLFVIPGQPSTIKYNTSNGPFEITATAIPEFHANALNQRTSVCPNILQSDDEVKSLTLSTQSTNMSPSMIPVCCGGSCGNGEKWSCCGGLGCCNCGSCCWNE